MDVIFQGEIEAERKRERMYRCDFQREIEAERKRERTYGRDRCTIIVNI